MEPITIADVAFDSAVAKELIQLLRQQLEELEKRVLLLEIELNSLRNSVKYQ